MGRSFTAGNSGPKIRSDCEATLEIKRSGGISIDIASRVKTLYGKSIEKQCREVITFFGIRNAHLTLKDSGALPFVISARIEAVISIAGLSGHKELLPGLLRENVYETERTRTRFSRLYLPGNNPAMMLNAGLHSADGIILDLEDSVAPSKKREARLIVRNALRQIDFRGAERMVRINQGDLGIEDLRFTVPHHVNMILLPKCESAEEIKRIDSEIHLIRKEFRLRNRVWLMPIIETARGVENCSEIAVASDNIVALAIGLEDYTTDIGVQRTTGGEESLYARMKLVNAARAAGIQPIDSVFSDVGDMEGLAATVKRSKALGFEGMGCIHPRQVKVIRNGYSPSPEEIEKAMKIYMAWDEASASGLGVVALGTKMIDPPVVERAIRTINLSVKLGLISADWMAHMRESEQK